jgi:hypothetical protein
VVKPPFLKENGDTAGNKDYGNIRQSFDDLRCLYSHMAKPSPNPPYTGAKSRIGRASRPVRLAPFSGSVETVLVGRFLDSLQLHLDFVLVGSASG